MYLYTTLKGQQWNLRDLSQEDLSWLFQLLVRAHNDDSYSLLRQSLAGPYAYPLKGSMRVTTEIHESPLYRIAEDIVDRVGIKQGVVGADPDDQV